ncbi:MAG: NAD(P)-dependent oxidoreductase [Pseudomonadota bacterium]
MFKTIGFIGLGAMGSRMVKHLKGVADIRVYDTDATRAAEAAAYVGGRAVKDISGMDGSDAVIMMLPTSAVVDQVLHGADGAKGLLDVLPRGSMVIDMSSSVPTNSVANAEIATKRGISFIDAPVSGGIKGAEAASLAIMAGGSQAEYDRALPLLQKMGANVFLVGKVGAGHAVKALNNLLAATTFVAASEVFAVGAKFGLDPSTMLKVVNASSGQNFQTTHVWEKAVIERTFSFGFALALMEKDVRVAMTLFDAMGSDAQLSRTSANIWAKALASAEPGSDMTVVAKQAEDVLGVRY